MQVFFNPHRAVLLSFLFVMIGFAGPAVCPDVNFADGPKETVGWIYSAQSISNSIGAIGEIDVYYFDGVENETIVLQVSGRANVFFDPAFEIIDPDGLVEVSISHSYCAIISDHKLIKSGTYTILVKDQDGTNTSDYDISFVKVPGALNHPDDLDGGEIFPSESMVDKYISVPSDLDPYTFQGNQNDTIAIRVCGNENVFYEPEFILYDPDGFIETSASHAYCAEIMNHKLLKTGTYTIIVKDNDGSYTCKYAFSFVKIPGDLCSDSDIDGYTIGVDTVYGNISHIGDLDPFVFTADEWITLQVCKGGNVFFNPAFDLYDQNGILETSGSGTSCAELNIYHLENPGFYTLVVKDHPGDATDSYSINCVNCSPVDGVESCYDDDDDDDNTTDDDDDDSSDDDGNDDNEPPDDDDHYDDDDESGGDDEEKEYDPEDWTCGCASLS